MTRLCCALLCARCARCTGARARRPQALLLCGWRMPLPPKVPGYFYPMMLDCWQEDRARRPTFSYLYDKLSKLASVERLRDTGKRFDEVLNVVARTLSIKSKRREASDDLLDAAGANVPGYEPSGPAYKPKLNEHVRRSAEAMLAEWRAKQGLQHASVTSAPLKLTSMEIVVNITVPQGKMLGVGIGNIGQGNFINGLRQGDPAAASVRFRACAALPRGKGTRRPRPCTRGCRDQAGRSVSADFFVVAVLALALPAAPRAQGLIRVGDHLMKVNDRSVFTASREDCIAALKEACQNGSNVRMVLQRSSQRPPAKRPIAAARPGGATK